MEYQLIKWNRSVPPSENKIREIYLAEGLNPYIWSNNAGDTYSAHSHSYHKVIYVVEGSIEWIFPHHDDHIETYPGDRLDLAAGLVHAAKVGPTGVTCMEAHK